MTTTADKKPLKDQPWFKHLTTLPSVTSNQVGALSGCYGPDVINRLRAASGVRVLVLPREEGDRPNAKRYRILLEDEPPRRIFEEITARELKEGDEVLVDRFGLTDIILALDVLDPNSEDSDICIRFQGTVDKLKSMRQGGPHPEVLATEGWWGPVAADEVHLRLRR